MLKVWGIFLINFSWASPIYQTKIYFDSNNFAVINFFEKQRPEDSIADFLLQYNLDKITYDDLYHQIIEGLRNELALKDILLDHNPERELIRKLNLANIGHPDKNIYIRKEYEPHVFVEWICSIVECTDSIYDDLYIKILDIVVPEADQFKSSNFYTVLGLPGAQVTQNDIKQSFKDLAKRFHPDKNQHRIKWATLVFANISVAYETLSDPITRKQHELFLSGSTSSTTISTSSSTSFSFTSSGGGFSFTFSFG